MENTAQAIVMAAGVLVAIALLTFFAFLFRRTGESTADIYSTLSESEITEFNQQFLNYDWEVTYTTTYDDSGGIESQGGKELTVQDVATLINLAMDNNKTQKLPTEIIVKIDVCEGEDEFSMSSITDTSEPWQTWLSENIATGYIYRCDVNVSGASKLVDTVSLTKLN